MAADGFVSLSRPDAGFNLIVVFVVDDIDGEYERLQAEGVAITTPMLSLAISLVTAAVVIVLAERVYRRSLMQTRRKVSFRQALKLED